LQPFTNILPNGNFAHHGGYLQHVIDSEADVVLDCTFSCNELVDIIASDLKGKIPPHRLFLSGLFDRTSTAAVLTEHVQGRAIRFSLNERVVEALKRQLDGLKFEETQWLHDLEVETNTFTIVLPVDHPDLPHVLNWITYRQIWFPHRAVHIKAQLHVMHTERLEQRPRADLFAISPDALDQLESLLRRERLIQLSGPPGCGKTTLASRFHRDAKARNEGGLVAPTPKSDDVSSQKQTCSAPVSCRFARLKRFSVTTQTDQLLMFLQADCDALLVVEEFNLQNDGWWDNWLDIKAPDGRFFYKGTYYESQHCKCVLLIGNSAMQGGRVSTAVETHCFLVECKAINLQELVQKAMPVSMFDDKNRLELQTWADSLPKNALFAQSNYALTLRDLEAVVFEALHVGVAIEQAGRRVLGYYCGDTLPVQQGIMQRVCSFLQPADGRARDYLTCKPTAQRRKHGMFFVGESGVGKTTMCLKAIESLKRPFFAMSQSDDELWAQVTEYLRTLQLSDPDARKQLESEMDCFGEQQLREKAVLVAAKRGLVLFIDELNTDRNLRLEETLNQVSARRIQFKTLT
jgi:GTPase SAR1 family protein